MKGERVKQALHCAQEINSDTQVTLGYSLDMLLQLGPEVDGLQLNILSHLLKEKHILAATAAAVSIACCGN